MDDEKQRETLAALSSSQANLTGVGYSDSSGNGSGKGGRGWGDSGDGGVGGNSNSGGSGDHAGSSEIKLKDDPRYSKYLKMVKVGLPKSAVADKMAADSIVASLEEGLQILGMDAERPVPYSLGGGGRGGDATGVPLTVAGSSSSESISSDKNMIAISEHPMYAKYFKMLRVGLPKETVQAKMQQEGIDASILDKSPDFKLAIEEKPENTGEQSVPVKDHPLYAKYFKMLKVGLPREAVKAKMQQEGVDPSILDKNPEDCAPVQASSSAGSTDDGPTVPVSEHPAYAKYFKMLKVGLPKEAVKAKMQQEGVDPSILDKAPDERISIASKQDGKQADKKDDGPKVAVQDHPIFSKYFKMLKVGLPKEAIKAKMQLEGADPNVLDMNPTDLISVEGSKPADDGPKIALQDHPLLAKYFKMLKIGLPKDTVKHKMQEEGIDPSYLDMDPTELVPVDLTKKTAAETKKKSPVLRKKRLHWKALDASKVREGTLWGDKDDDDNEIMLDEAEFNELFTESKDKAKEAVSLKPQEPKKQRINLIDMKRGQNAGIALARIKLSFEEVKKKIMQFDDEAFTTDQLKSLDEYLPAPEEARLIKGFKGDPEMLGQAEKYMSVMLGFSTASKRIQCMIFKQQFKNRILEVKHMVSKIECACDDVKLSGRFKKLLKTILKVGNQLNDGADHAGFTVDSLLKLNSAKAFDKKTSILQYVVMLIHRNAENCLHFTEDLTHVPEASRISMDSIFSERALIRQSLKTSCDIVLGIKDNFSKGTEDPSSRNGIDAIDNFLAQANKICDDLDEFIDTMKSKYSSVLLYFGEEPSMLSHEFFATLNKFLQEFVTTREQVYRTLKAEEKKAKDSENKTEAKARRASLAIGSKIPGSSSEGDITAIMSEMVVTDQEEKESSASDSTALDARVDSADLEIKPAASALLKMKRRASAIL